MPGPGDFCHGCNRLLCRCRPEPDCDAHYEVSYEANGPEPDLGRRPDAGGVQSPPEAVGADDWMPF